MSTCEQFIDLLNNRIIEVDTTPDLLKYKPVVILKEEQLGKLLEQFEIMHETWIALKFNETVFVIWKELIFLFVRKSNENELGGVAN